MILLKILLSFIIPANIVMLVLICNNFNKRLGNYFTLLLSYGIGPLLNGLVFYYLLLLLPQKNAVFYITTCSLFWLAIFFFSTNKISEIKLPYIWFFDYFKKNLNKLELLLYFFVFSFTLLFSIQALFYPIADGDSAYYFLQSEALDQSKDPNWHQNGSIMLHGSDEYNYNPMIRPGIPAVTAFSLMLNQRGYDYLAFNFFFVYYYYLLLGIFLLVVSKLAFELKINRKKVQFFALLFFVFYWNMTRFFIFDNKEVSIFFFALAGICLVHELILLKKRDVKLEILLGLILGLNAFVNLHGILIMVFSLVTLFIFSKLPFWQRIFQGLLVFSLHLIFGVFEFLFAFRFIFSETLLGIFKDNNIESTQAIEAVQVVETQHLQMYQTPNMLEIYLKGKLQIITNPGSYGFYFLFFILILLAKFKKLFFSNFAKVLLFFTILYYFVIIDPLSMNKNSLAVVLWGSPKYSMLVVLLVLIFVAVYFEAMIEDFSRFVSKKSSYLAGTSIAGIAFLVIFKDFVLSLGLRMLTSFVQVTRDISFYSGKVILFYEVLLVILVSFSVLTFLIYLNKIKKANSHIILLVLCSIFMITPFFIADAGKVPLYETLHYINSDNETKFKNIIYFGDLFGVYYYAKSNLPKETLIKTNYCELYPNNTYFNLRGSGDLEARYEIVGGKCKEGSEMYSQGAYSLCHANGK